MATDNSSVKPNGLTPDIYDIADYVNSVKQEFTPDVDEDTLMLGIFGYFGSLMSSMFQNDIIMAAEFANESIPTRARFEKNVIAHALALNVSSINAVPSKMECYITFVEKEIIDAIGGESGEFTFDCDNKIYFNQYEFHPDYDIIINRVKLVNNKYAYTARYDINGEGIYDNPVSDITNPYLPPPIVMRVNGTDYLFLTCTLRQVEKTVIYKKIMSDNTISSKTVNFQFDSQLAAFDVDVKSGNDSIPVHLVPVYEGLSTQPSKYPHIWFTYLDSKTIRIKFDRDSYSPRINSDVEIRLQTCQGSKGNVNWVGEPQLFSFDSERLGYSNITVHVKPLSGESKYGINKKSVEDLRKIIPREALSRGSITNTKDLYNFFNALNSDLSNLYLYKKRDNNMERLYHSYMVMKDKDNNVLPTNTINLMIRPDQLLTDNDRAKLILRRGQIIKLDSDKTTGFISRINKDDNVQIDYTDSFYYVIPYNFAICMNPMYGIYFLTTMNETRTLIFQYINDKCLYQFITTAVDWTRNYLEDDDKYKMHIDVIQNIVEAEELVHKDPDTGEFLGADLRAIVVFYKDNLPFRFVEGNLTEYVDGTFKFDFEMKSNDYINKYNEIRIEGLNPVGELQELINYGYMPAECPAMIHILSKQPAYSTSLDYKDIYNTKANLGTIINGLEGWTVTNSYVIKNGINFFYDYSEIIYSTIKVGEGEYIPPDEPDNPEPTPPPDYKPGGPEIKDPIYGTLATEKAVKDMVNKAMMQLFGYIPRFATDETGALYLEDHISDLTGVVSHDTPTLGTGEDGEIIGWDETPYKIPQFGELVLIDGFGWPPVLKKIDPPSPDDPDDPNKIIIYYTTNPDGTFDSINFLRKNSDVSKVIMHSNVDQDLKEFDFDLHSGKSLDFTTLAPSMADLDKTLEPANADKHMTLSDEVDDTETEEPTPPSTDEPENPETPPVEKEKKYTVGGDEIDCFNASDYTIATENGVVNLVKAFIKETFDVMPKLIKGPNGTLIMTDKFGRVILGDEGSYKDAIGDLEEPDDPDIDIDDPDDPDDKPGSTIKPGTSGGAVIPADDGIGYQISPEEAKKYHFIIQDVPVIKYDYFISEELVQDFCKELVDRKNWIEECLTKMEDTFGLNFKFVNTYGPSRLFTLDDHTGYINRVNLSLTFRLGLQVNYDENIVEYIKRDVKEYVEDINNIRSLHMSNLISEITEKYKDSITFFEFVDMNGYGPAEQHLYSMKMPDNVITPELINIHTLVDRTPDINIILA